jgi:hypothetical protein
LLVVILKVISIGKAHFVYSKITVTTESRSGSS